MRIIYTGSGFRRVLQLVLLMLFYCVAPAQNKATQLGKKTFAGSDVFQSAVFLENRKTVVNNTDENILYYSAHDNVNAFFTETGLFYEVTSIDPASLHEGKATKDDIKKGSIEDEGKKGVPIVETTIKMTWLGCNPHPHIAPGEKAPGYHTYIKNTGEGFKGLTTEGYKTIKYEDLYPGIDVEYSFPGKGGMKYNLIVHPGADLSKVKFAYLGNNVALSLNKAGDLVAHTETGEIIEHAPVSFTDGGKQVDSRYILTGDEITFYIPGGYDSRSTLTVDPWITSLTTMPPLNMGFDVDYDYLGDLIAYGAGPTGDVDLNDNFQVSKYSPGGTFLWNFNGTVPAINWSTQVDTAPNSPIAVIPGNCIVDRVSGKIYVGEGWEPEVGNWGGTIVIRLTSAGAYDNFESTSDTSFLEDWGLMYKCADGSVLALGGGISSNINMGIVNTTTGAVTKSNITGLSGPNEFYAAQDILCGTYDSAGNLYVIMNSADIIDPLPYANTVYAVNSTFNGNLWSANSNYNVFNEANNDPFWESTTTYGTGNWFNCLAANGSYLFYYDGKHLEALSFTNGARVGNAVTIAGQTVLMQAGIAVDNCNNVYVGGVGEIRTYSFNGTTFTAGAPISLGGAYGADPVLDIKYNSSNNLLYVTGKGFVGTFNATLSTTCTTTPFTTTTSHTCNSATVNINPVPNINPATFTIIWTDSLGNVLSQAINTASTTNTITGLSNGTYFVQIQWNENCGGTQITDTVPINCDTLNLTVTPDTTVCAGQSVTITATPSIAGGTYLWSPGNQTTQSITVTPGATTVYTVTYSVNSLTATATDTIHVNVNPVNVTVNNATECSGNAATLIATPSVPGGTYLWSPGGATTDTIVVTPVGTTTYTVTYTLACGSATGSGEVTLAPAPALALTESSTCAAGSGVITATGSSGTSPYQYALNGGASQASNSFTGLNPGLDTIEITDANGCTATDAITVTSLSNVAFTLASTAATCAGGNGSITVTTSAGTAPFQYSLNGGALQNQNTFNGLNSGLDTVEVQDATGCSSVDTITVASTSGISLSLQGVPATCVGGDGEIYATVTGGVAPLQYSINGGAFQAADSFTALNAGFYTVEAEDANSCTATDTITITTLNGVTLSLQVTNPTCAGGNGQIVATAVGSTQPYAFTLNGGTAQASGTFTGLNDGFYTVQVQSAAGCNATDTVTLKTTNSVTIQLQATNPLCAGDSGSITATGAGGVSPYQYSFNGGAYQNSGVFAEVAPGTYTITAEDANTCTATASATVNQAPSQITLAPTVTPDSCPGFSDGTMSAGAAGGTPPYNYAWSNNGPDAGTDPNLAQGNYNVTVTDANGCTASVSASITALPGIAYIANVHNIFCVPLQNGSIQITVTQGTPPINYLWSNGQTDSSINMLTPGTYGLSMTSGGGCTLDTSFTIVNDSAFSLSVFPTDTTIVLGNFAGIRVIPNGDNISFMYWSPNEFLLCDTCAATSASPIQTMWYTAHVTSDSGCTGVDSILVTVIPEYNIFVPNAFSPNGDGNNDYFSVYGQKEDWKQFSIKLFDRWGEKVFESEDENFQWDGRYKGHLMDPQVLVWEIHLTYLDNHTEKVLKGSVTLIR